MLFHEKCNPFDFVSNIITLIHNISRKLIIDDFLVRTTRVNEVISPICRPVIDFGESKNENCPEILGRSYEVYHAWNRTI